MVKEDALWKIKLDWAAGAAYRIPMPVVAVIYGKDLVVALGTVALLALVGRVSVVARWTGKAATFFQLLLVILTLLAPDLDRLKPGAARVVLAALWWFVAGVSVAAAVDYVGVGVRQLLAAKAAKAAADPDPVATV